MVSYNNVNNNFQGYYNNDETPGLPSPTYTPGQNNDFDDKNNKKDCNSLLKL